MSRKTARVKAFQLVFQSDFHESEEAGRLLEIFNSENNLNESDGTFIAQIVNGVAENSALIDGIISKNLNNWGMDRVSKVDMAIMRISIFEMLKMDDITSNVSINEAVEIAKVYGSDDSPAFVNGVLGAVDKMLKEEG